MLIIGGYGIRAVAFIYICIKIFYANNSTFFLFVLFLFHIFAKSIGNDQPLISIINLINKTL